MPFFLTCQKEEIILHSYTLLSTICVTASHNYLHTESLISLIPNKQKIKLTLIFDQSLQRLGINIVEFYFSFFRNLTRHLLKHTLRNLSLERNSKWRYSPWRLNVLHGQLKGIVHFLLYEIDQQLKEYKKKQNYMIVRNVFLHFLSLKLKSTPWIGTNNAFRDFIKKKKKRKIEGNEIDLNKKNNYMSINACLECFYSSNYWLLVCMYIIYCDKKWMFSPPQRKKREKLYHMCICICYRH